MEIIPAIDIIGGKCVRLTQGDYLQKKVYHEDPALVAKRFEEAGLKRLHLVDLDGAKKGRPENLEILRGITETTSLIVDYGGGIRCMSDAKAAFSAGASQITGGSLAVHNRPEFLRWIEQFGPSGIILGADVKDEQIRVNGWTEKTNLNVYDFIGSFYEQGLRKVICTDISRDGLLKGSAIGLYEKILHRFPAIELIASGGVTTLTEIEKLKNMGMNGVIIGKALYENKISVIDLAKYVN